MRSVVSRTASLHGALRWSVLLLAGLVSSLTQADDWNPPDDADPQAILQEARDDARAKRYEIALAKHVWFFENALAIRRSLYGVRLSFALSYWKELADEYPPALTKLKDLRDKALQNVESGHKVRESFHDLVAINRQLDEQSATQKVFETLDERNPEIANEVFQLAQPALVKGKAYTLIGKYISPKEDFARIKEMYRQSKTMAEDARFGARHLEFANKSFANGSATLVAILALNDRQEEAKEIAAAARAEWDESSFRSILGKALNGVVPAPWP